MKPAHIWLKIFLTGFAAVFVMFLVTILTPAPYGDLSRIGRISEADFGWRSKQPLIPSEQLLNWPIDKADVAVIGDSFSMGFAWQSALSTAGYRVATINWDTVDTLCADFSQWLRGSGFRGRVVIVETIERTLSLRIAKSRKCRSTSVLNPEIAPAANSPPIDPPPFALNVGAKLVTGAITYSNSRRIRRADRPIKIGVPGGLSSVTAQRVENGCSQFSHRLCQKALFLTHDVELPELTPDDAAFLDGFARRAAPLQIVWMVVPNKTTVYLDQQRSAAFAQEIEKRSLGPNLFSMAQQFRLQTVDLYLPNDTHWSTRGQLMFGHEVLQHLRRSSNSRETEK